MKSQNNTSEIFKRAYKLSILSKEQASFRYKHKNICQVEYLLLFPFK